MRESWASSPAMSTVTAGIPLAKGEKREGDSAGCGENPQIMPTDWQKTVGDSGE